MQKYIASKVAMAPLPFITLFLFSPSLFVSLSLPTYVWVVLQSQWTNQCDQMLK